MHHPFQPGRVLHPFGETLCRYYLPEESVLVREPSAFHFLPAASGEFLTVIIDLLLRVAVDHERDGFGELEIRPAVQGGELLTIQLERHRHDLAFLFGKFFAGVMRDLFDLRIFLEHRDVEICRFFRLVIEPQHWSNSLHVSWCAQRDAMQSPRCEVRAGPALHWHWTGSSALAIQMDLAFSA